MKIAAIIQARMSSRRLSGKVLLEINGKPLLNYIIESLKRCRGIDDFIVATSYCSEDDAIDELCGSLGINCFRGDLENTADRLLKAAESSGCDAFARVNGDSPLADYRLIDKGCELMRAGSWDLVTNVRPRTFPKGLSVEVVRTSAFASAVGKMSHAYDQEHVTPFLYSHPQDYRIHPFTSPINHSHLNFCVDTEDDLARVSALMSAMVRPHWQYAYDDLVSLDAVERSRT